MRYQIGQVIPVINFTISHLPTEEMPNPHPYVSTFFLPWEVKIEQTNFRILTVKEHHKVSWEYDSKGENQCDGYILEDQNNRQWFNQYPQASYGQLSTDADNQFHLSSDDYEKESAEDISKFMLVTEYLCRVQRGIEDLTKMAPADSSENLNSLQEKINSLKAHFQDVSNQLKELCGKTVVIIPLVFKRKDSDEREYYEDIKTGYIEGEIPEERKLEGAINRTKQPREVQ